MEIETLVKRNPETMRIEERTAVGSPKGYEPGDPGSNYSSTAKVVTVELGGLSGGSGGGGGGGGGGGLRESPRPDEFRGARAGADLL